MLTDEQWLAELVRFYGWQHAGKILGYCVIAALRGKTKEDLDSMPEYTTGWRMRQDLKLFKRHMQALGKWPEDPDVPDDQLVADAGRRAARVQLGAR